MRSEELDGEHFGREDQTSRSTNRDYARREKESPTRQPGQSASPHPEHGDKNPSFLWDCHQDLNKVMSVRHLEQVLARSQCYIRIHQINKCWSQR